MEIGFVDGEELELFVATGLVSSHQIQSFLSYKAGQLQAPIPFGFTNHCIDRLLYFGFLEAYHVSGLPPVYKRSQDPLEKIPVDSFWTAIFGLPFMIRSVSEQTFLVSVENQGNYHSGTAFLTYREFEKRKYLFLVTNKHIVDPDQWKIVEIVNHYGKVIPAESVSGVICHDSQDLALIPFGWHDNNERPGLAEIAQNEPSMLTDIFTVGYPSVGYSKSRGALAHSGQVNGYVKLLDDRDAMIISADVAPGNSGCPVVNELGIVVGMVTEDLEGLKLKEYSDDDSKIRASIHHSAIPCAIINNFLDKTMNRFLG